MYNIWLKTSSNTELVFWTFSSFVSQDRETLKIKMIRAYNFCFLLRAQFTTTFYAWLVWHICDDVALYNTSILRWISVLGVHLDHHCTRLFLFIHHWCVIRTVSEHRLMIAIFIILKAQEKRTAISAGVTWCGATPPPPYERCSRDQSVNLASRQGGCRGKRL